MLKACSLVVSAPGLRGRASILDRLSLELKAGEILGLTGASGAGKSTAALALCGLVEPPLNWDGGVIRLGERLITPGEPRQWRGLRGREIFLIFQSPGSALNPNRRVGGQLTETLHLVLGLPLQGIRRRVLSLLQEVGLPDSAFNAYPYQLSGGMRQRVLIALALGLGPQVIIADEPTSGLDPIRQREIVELMCRLPRERGSALLLISHDLRLLKRYTQRILVLHSGRVVEAGPTRMVLDDPRHPCSRGLVKSLRAMEMEDVHFTSA